MYGIAVFYSKNILDGFVLAINCVITENVEM